MVIVGTTMFFVCMVHHPELNDKIELMVAMGPVSTLARLRSGLRFAVPFTEYIQACIYYIKLAAGWFPKSYWEQLILLH